MWPKIYNISVRENSLQHLHLNLQPLIMFTFFHFLSWIGYHLRAIENANPNSINSLHNSPKNGRHYQTFDMQMLLHVYAIDLWMIIVAKCLRGKRRPWCLRTSMGTSTRHIVKFGRGIIICFLDYLDIQCKLVMTYTTIIFPMFFFVNNVATLFATINVSTHIRSTCMTEMKT